jgi:hypothetical protein
VPKSKIIFCEKIILFFIILILAAIMMTNHIQDSEVVGQACGALLNLSLEPKSRELVVALACAQTMRAVAQEQAEHPDIPPLANRILVQLLKERAMRRRPRAGRVAMPVLRLGIRLGIRV